MLPETAQQLIKEFRNFPTVGTRTAVRFVLHLIKLPERDFKHFVSRLSQLQRKIKLCAFCFKPFEPNGQSKLCEICVDTSRKHEQLCVVEKETDLEALENTKSYKGLYFVLGGLVNRLRKEDLRALRVPELKARLLAPNKFGLKKDGSFKEIILAINPTSEGEATLLYLERELTKLQIKTTRLGRGLPTGGELEYADEQTIMSALESRR